jgi:hypothetical protein
MKLKTLTFRLLVPEDGADNVEDAVLDFLCFSLEGVEILKAKVRDAKKKEIKRYRKEFPNEDV